MNAIFGAEELKAAKMQSKMASADQKTARSVIMRDAASIMGPGADKMLQALMEQAASTDKNDAMKTLIAKATLMPLDRLASLYEEGAISEKEYATELKLAIGSTQKTLARLQSGKTDIKLKDELEELADANILTDEQNNSYDIKTLRALFATDKKQASLVTKAFQSMQANLGTFRADQKFANSSYSIDYENMAEFSKSNDPNKGLSWQNASMFNRESIGQLIGATAKFEDLKAKKLDELIKTTNSSNEELIKAIREGTTATQTLVDRIQTSQDEVLAVGGPLL